MCAHLLLLTAPHVLLASMILLRVATTPDARGYGTHEQLGLGPCRFRDWLDAPCPTCGVTTSASHLVHGDWQHALGVQPLGVLGVAFVLWLAFVAWRVHLAGGDLVAWWARHGVRIWSLVGLAVLACWGFVLAR